jgi:multiple sugar transport system permease protein
MSSGITRMFRSVPLIVALGLTVLPYLWIFLGSFKTHEDLFARPIKWFFEPTVDAYVQLYNKDFLGFLLNSAVVGFGSTLLCLTVGTLAAYCFSRYKVPAGNHLFFYILATRLGPPIAYALPMYLVFDKIGLANTHFGLILAHATFNLVLVVWMMRSFFDEIPREIEEAAILDGCGPFRIFFLIALPLTTSGLVAVAIFVLIFSWNELLFALILTSNENRTLTAMLPTLVGHPKGLWPQVAAASVIQSVPVLIFVFFVQKHLVRGLTFGAVKG